jgi:hypothetical protein
MSRWASGATAAGLFVASLLVQSGAAAQYPPQPPGYGPPPGGPPPGYGPPPPGYGPPGYGPPPPGYGPPGYGPPGYGPPPGPPVSTGLEMGFLYGTSAAWGIGVGIWIDAEIWNGEEVNPGLSIIAPALFGAAAPLTVLLIDQFAFERGMPEGMPSAIATGLLVGAGEGLGIAGTQWVTAEEENEWGFVGLARAEVISSTIGAAGGVALYYLVEPRPESNALISSSIFWGTAIGSFFGGGVSRSSCRDPFPWDDETPDPDGEEGPLTGAEGSCGWGESNDTVSFGGLIGFNIALAGSVAASIFWVPSWDNIGWGWGGFAIGAAASALVYPFYAAAPSADPRTGLIAQGIGATVGLGLGIALSEPGTAVYGENDDEKNYFATPTQRRQIQIQGASMMPVDNGMGVQLNGAIW